MYDIMSGNNTYALCDGLFTANDAAINQFPLVADLEANAAKTYYETDIATLSLALYPRGGAAYIYNGCIQMNAAGELAETTFFISEQVDTSRAITIDFVILLTANFGDGHVNVTYSIDRVKADCSGTTAGVISDTEDITCTTTGKFSHETKTISASDVQADCLYFIDFVLNDAAPADITLCSITLRYYIKRTV